MVTPTNCKFLTSSHSGKKETKNPSISNLRPITTEQHIAHVYNPSPNRKRLRRPEYSLILPIPFQPFNSDRDSISFLSGQAPATQKGLLVIMGIFMGLAVVGMIAEVVYRRVRKAKVQNGEGM